MGAVLAHDDAATITRSRTVRPITPPPCPARSKGGYRSGARQLQARRGAFRTIQFEAAAQVCGTALRMALPPLITTLNSMFFALCFCISSGTWARIREAMESKEMPAVDSPQRFLATRYVS